MEKKQKNNNSERIHGHSNAPHILLKIANPYFLLVDNKRYSNWPFVALISKLPKQPIVYIWRVLLEDLNIEQYICYICLFPMWSLM